MKINSNKILKTNYLSVLHIRISRKIIHKIMVFFLHSLIRLLFKIN